MKVKPNTEKSFGKDGYGNLKNKKQNYTRNAEKTMKSLKIINLG